MIIEGFTYVRNGLKMDYPFLVSIQSILPVVDRMIVVVGNSEDGTREAVENLNDPKIEIIDNLWDEELRTSGAIFRQQANIGVDALRGDWGIHIQADEVIHEKDLAKLREQIELAQARPEVDGLLFPFYHFRGDYFHIHNTRRTHPYEIRAFKTGRNVRSYKDSQGFRIFDPNDPGDVGTKLKVLKTDIPIFHYSYTRHPSLMKRKANYFHRFWHGDEWLKAHTEDGLFNFNEVDILERFEGSHPALMAPIIARKDWDFVYDPSQSNMKPKEKFLYWVQRKFGKRLFGYKNYKLIR
ncbi:MAG TPA: hypothetical protein DIW47_00715 [Bacteroidetes bacterium]|nr:hypothetical protein [Bacteroidota bacterium]